jgi:RNA polymerase sigma-70 factor (ECF subfamily)
MLSDGWRWGPRINFLAGPVYLAEDADDQSIVRQCLAGDAASFEALVTRYQRVFFTLAVRMLGDREDASDVVQNAFIKIYENLHTFDPARRFFSWAYRILVNECLNARRARRPVEPIPLNLSSAGGPLEALETEERRRRVRQALLGLSFEHREVVVLRHFTELSYEEIGSTLNLPVATVKSRLHAARQRLTRALLAEFVA